MAEDGGKHVATVPVNVRIPAWTLLARVHKHCTCQCCTALPCFRWHCAGMPHACVCMEGKGSPLAPF